MGDEQAGLYGEKIYAHVRKHNEEFYSGFSTLLRKTFDEALDDICDGSIDLLHIDGLHTYEAVSNDFTTWLPKVKMGGYVLFHDTMVHSEGFGVWRLWNDLISKYPNHINFQHSFGLGIVQITPHASSTDSWLRPGSENQQFMIDYFASLGDIYQVVYERDEAKRLLNKKISRIKSMQNSLSWKITTPFRMLADALG
jgi:hemolysin-activating ACP:hemolysin acyltransferase